MPHVIIEHSANVAIHCDLQALVDTVHETAAHHEVPAIEALRTRAVGRDHYRIGDGDPAYAFVAITIRIGPGRTPEQKRDLLTVILNAAEAFLATNAPDLVVAFSCEVQEIDSAFRTNRNHVRTHMHPPTEET